MDSELAYEIKRMNAGEQHAAAKHYTSLYAFMVPPNNDGSQCPARTGRSALQIIVASNDTSVSTGNEHSCSE
jgi:hypothetical protein